jgi:hypothetical protein
MLVLPVASHGDDQVSAVSLDQLDISRTFRGTDHSIQRRRWSWDAGDVQGGSLLARYGISGTAGAIPPPHVAKPCPRLSDQLVVVGEKGLTSARVLRHQSWYLNRAAVKVRQKRQRKIDMVPRAAQDSGSSPDLRRDGRI